MPPSNTFGEWQSSHAVIVTRYWPLLTRSSVLGPADEQAANPMAAVHPKRPILDRTNEVMEYIFAPDPTRSPHASFVPPRMWSKGASSKPNLDVSASAFEGECKPFTRLGAGVAPRMDEIRYN